MAMGRRKRIGRSRCSSPPRTSPGRPGIRSTGRSYRLLPTPTSIAGSSRGAPRYYEQEEERGRPSIPPGVYFRMLLVGYFEGIDSQRASPGGVPIAWRCASSWAPP